MKKVLIIMMVVLSLTLTGCKKSKDLIEISYDELREKIENKDSFVLYVGSSECSHCAEYRPILEKVIYKYSLDVYYINLAKLSDSKKQAVLKKAEAEGTPTTVDIEKGTTKTSPRVEGAREYDEIVTFFKDLNMLRGA